MSEVFNLAEVPEGLSARAYGVFCYALVTGGRFTVSGLVGVFSEGRDALTTACDELVDAGLAERIAVLDRGMKRQYIQLTVEAA